LQLEGVGYRIVVPAKVNAGQLFYVRVPRASVDDTFESSDSIRSTLRSTIRDGESSEESRERQILGQRVENALAILRQSLPELLPNADNNKAASSSNEGTGEWVTAVADTLTRLFRIIFFSRIVLFLKNTSSLSLISP
jgi:dsDNA-specific endonuclease/ATPase MutS2